MSENKLNLIYVINNEKAYDGLMDELLENGNTNLFNHEEIKNILASGRTLYVSTRDGEVIIGTKIKEMSNVSINKSTLDNQCVKCRATLNTDSTFLELHLAFDRYTDKFSLINGSELHNSRFITTHNLSTVKVLQKKNSLDFKITLID